MRSKGGESMSDIFDLVSQVVADSPAHKAMAKCDEVQRFIRHAQIDGKWGEPLDSAQLMFVSQYTMPDGALVFLAGMFVANTLITMVLAEKDGEYVKLSPDAIWGGVGLVGGGET